MRKDLATHDLLVLRDLSFADLEEGERVVADGCSGSEFSFAVSQAAVADEAAKNGLGGRITVEVEPTRVQASAGSPRGGTFEAKVFVQRERDVGQPANDLATGEVVFTVSLPFAPERLAEANFAVVAPIAACGAARGPGENAGCAAVDREAIVDATGIH